MTEMYKSPVITVEELMKEDVLCESNPVLADNVAVAASLLEEAGDILGNLEKTI
jgi:hypothetical protein